MTNSKLEMLASTPEGVTPVAADCLSNLPGPRCGAAKWTANILGRQGWGVGLPICADATHFLQNVQDESCRCSLAHLLQPQAEQADMPRKLLAVSKP